MINIIMPVYNCEKYLTQCLDSLYGQTYKNFRIIAIDDGSADNSLQILKSYKAKHDNFEIITQKNLGPAAARNAGLELAKKLGGEFLAFIDADDWVEPNFLEELVNLMDDNVGLASCGYRWQKRTDKHFKNKKSEVLTLDTTEGLCQLFVDKYLYCSLWNKLLRSEFVKDLWFDTNLFLGEDTSFMIEYIVSLPANCKAKHSTKDLYHYNMTPGGLSYIGFNQRKLKILDKFPQLEKLIEQTGQKAKIYFNSWRFLLLFEFVFYFRKIDKEKHKLYKNMARELLKDYKSVRHDYRPFRRYVNYIFWAL